MPALMKSHNYRDAAPITPSDTATAIPATGGKYDALYIGGAGNVAVRMAGSARTTTFTAVPVGAILPIQVDRVMATNTTATLIIGLRY